LSAALSSLSITSASESWVCLLLWSKLIDIDMLLFNLRFILFLLILNHWNSRIDIVKMRSILRITPCWILVLPKIKFTIKSPIFILFNQIRLLSLLFRIHLWSIIIKIRREISASSIGCLVLSKVYMLNFIYICKLRHLVLHLFPSGWIKVLLVLWFDCCYWVRSKLYIRFYLYYACIYLLFIN
jgi:hypothetical protein